MWRATERFVSCRSTTETNIVTRKPTKSQNGTIIATPTPAGGSNSKDVTGTITTLILLRTARINASEKKRRSGAPPERTTSLMKGTFFQNLLTLWRAKVARRNLLISRRSLWNAIILSLGPKFKYFNLFLFLFLFIFNKMCFSFASFHFIITQAENQIKNMQ